MSVEAEQSRPAGPPVRIRLRLEHACLQHIADGVGARILHVKGEALHPSLSERRGPSSDCDVLVHPDDVAAYTAALAAHDWELHTTFARGSVFGHAATYYHPRWGTVDVHRHFPGLDRDPRLSFEVLSASATTASLGGRDVPVPDLLGQRLVLLVHAARDAMGRAEHDREVAWDVLDEPERAQLDRLAERLGAAVPLLIATGRGDLARGLPRWRTWQAMHRHANPTEVWLARLADAQGLRGRARVLAASLLPNRDHLAIRLGHEPTEAELRREGIERFGRGAQRLWSAARRGLRGGRAQGRPANRS